MPINWGDVFKGTAGGATTGAGVGALSANPAGVGLGAAGGAGLGFLTSILSYLLSGESGKKAGAGRQDINPDIKQVSTVSPEAQSILQFLLQQGQQGLQNPYEGFGDIENQARQQFSEQTIPGIAERFSSLGNNAQSSGAFQSQLGRAGVGLESNLEGMRNQYGQQNRQNAMQMLALGLSPSVQNYFQQNQPGFGSELLNQSVQAAPALYQSYMKNKSLQR